MSNTYLYCLHTESDLPYPQMNLLTLPKANLRTCNTDKSACGKNRAQTGE